MADRYWVGGTGTWNTTSTTNWSATSGGAGGASVPTVADNVIFNQAATYTVTMTGALACLSITVSAGVVTFATGTTPTLNVRGSWSTIAGTVWNSTGLVTFTSTTAATVTSGGITIGTSFTFNGTGGTWTLQDGLTLSSASTATLTTGTLALQSFSLTCGSFSASGTLTRAINFGTGSIILTRNTAGSLLDINAPTGLTLSGSKQVITQGSGAVTKTITINTTFTQTNVLNFQLNDTAGTISIGTSRVGNLTINGAFTFTASAPIIYGSYTYISGTIASNADSTGWTIGPTSGSHTIDFGGVTHDTRIVFGVSAAGSTAVCTFNSNITIGATRSITFNSGTWNFNNKTVTSGASITFQNQSITLRNNAGSEINLSPYNIIHGSGSGVTLETNLTTTGTYQFGASTLSLGSFTITCDNFSSSITNPRSLNFGTGRIDLTGNNKTIWNTGTIGSMTYTGTVYVRSTYAGAVGTRTFDTGGMSEAVAAGFNVSTSGSSGIVIGTATDTVALTGNYNNFDLTGLTNTLSNTARTIYGNFTIPASGGTLTAGTLATTFAGAGSETITTNGRTLDFPITFNATGTFSLSDALTVGSTRTVTLTAGTLSLQSFTLSCAIFSGTGTTARTLAFGTGQLTLVGNAATIFDVTTATNFSTTGTVKIVSTYTGATGTRTFVTGFTEAQSAAGYNVNTSGSGGITFGTTATDTVAFTGSFGNFDLTGLTNTLSNTARTIYGNFTVPSSGGTITAGTATTTLATTGSKTVDGNGRLLDFPITVTLGIGTVTLLSNLTIGSTRTLTFTSGTFNFGNFVASTGLFSSSNSNARTLAFGSSGQLTLTGNGVTVWDTTTATNFVFTGTHNIFSSYTGATGTRTFSFGSVAEAYLFNIKFAASAQSNSLTIATSTDIVAFTGNIRDFDLTNFTNTLAAGARNIYGDFTTPTTGGSLTTTAIETTFVGSSGTSTITTNGRSIPIPLTFNGLGKTFQQFGATTTTQTLTLTAGTLDLNDFTFGASVFSSTGTGVRTLAFGSTPGLGGLTLSGSSATIISIATATNFNFTGSPYILSTYVGSAGSRQINLGSSAQGYFNSTANTISVNTTGTDGIILGTSATDSIILNGFVKNLNLTGMGFSFTNTTRTIYGNLTIPPTGGTVQAGTLITTLEPSANVLANTNGRLLDFPVTILANTANSITLSSNLSMGTTRTISFLRGTLSLNNQTLTTNTFNTSTANIRTLDFGSTGQIILPNNAVTIWESTVGTGFSYAGTPRIFASNTSSAGTRTMNFGTIPGDFTFNISFSAGAGAAVQPDSFTIRSAGDTVRIGGNIRDLNLTGFSNIIFPEAKTLFGNLSVSASGGTISPATNIQTNTITFSGNTGTSTISTNGRSIVLPFVINGNTLEKTVKQLDATTILAPVSVNGGTIDLNDLTFTSTALYANTRSKNASISFGNTGSFIATANGTTGSSGSEVLVVYMDYAANLSWTGTPKIVSTYTGSANGRAFWVGYGVGYEPIRPEYAFDFIVGTGTGISISNTSGDRILVEGTYNNIDLRGSNNTLRNGERWITGNLYLSTTAPNYFGVTGLSSLPVGGSKVTTFTGNDFTYIVDTMGRFTDFPMSFEGRGNWNIANSIYLTAAANTAARTLRVNSGNVIISNTQIHCTDFISDRSDVRSLDFNGSGSRLIMWRSGGSVWNTATGTNLALTGNIDIRLANTSSTGTRTINFGTISEQYAPNVTVTPSRGFSLNTAVETFALSGNTGSLNLIGLNGTISNLARNVHGDLTFPATGGTFTAGAIATTLAATSGTETITYNNRTIDFPIIINGTGGTFVANGNVLLGATRTLTLTNGTFDANSANITASTITVASGNAAVSNLSTTLTVTHTSGNLNLSSNISTGDYTLTTGYLNPNNYTITTRTFSSSGSGVRGINFGDTGKIQLSANAAVTYWNTGTLTNFTYTGNSNIETIGTGNNVTKTINTGTMSESQAMNWTLKDSASVLITPTASNAFRNLNIDGPFVLSNIPITIYGDYIYDAPYTDGYQSVYFDGNDYLIVAANSAFAFGTGDFTVEGWVYLTAATSSRLATNRRPLNTQAGTWGLNLSATTMSFTEVIGGEPGPTATFSSIQNQWAHVAASRTSGTTRLFVNGTQVASAAQTTNFNSTAYSLLIATSPSENFITGYVSNLRIVKGTGLYTGAFTPSTTPLTAVANTSLLICRSNLPDDLSDNRFNISINGNAGASYFNPFNSANGAAILSGTNAWTFASSNTQTLTSNSFAYDFPITFAGTGTATLQDNLTTANAKTTTLTSGTLNLNDNVLRTGLFSSTNSNARSIGFANTGKIQLSPSTAVTMWNSATPTNFSYTGNSNIETIGSGAVTKTINTGVMAEFQSLNWNLKDTAGTIAFTSGNAVNNLNINGAFTLSNIPITIYGDYTYTTATALTAGTNVWTFQGINNALINAGGVTHNFPWTINKNSSNLTLQSATTVDSTRTTSFNRGTFNLNGYNYTTGIFDIGYSSSVGLPNSMQFVGRYLRTDDPTNTIFSPHTGVNFTIEFWFYYSGGSFSDIIGYRTTGASNVYLVDILSDKVRFVTGGGYGNLTITSNSTISTNTWYHVAVVREGTGTDQTKLYVNGQLEGVGTLNDTTAPGVNARFFVGASALDSFNGFISNFRFVREVAVYTSEFVAPISPLTNITGTQLLVCATDNPLQDKSPYQRSIVYEGSSTYAPPAASNNTPFLYNSVYFDGVDDYLSIAAGASGNLSSGDFTVELWFYPTTTGTSRSLIQQGEHDWRIEMGPSNNLGYTTQNVGRITGGTAAVLNAWNHMAISRVGSTTTLYLNGVSQGTTAASPANSTSPIAIGINTASIGTVWDFTGYISNARVVKGTGVYTSDFSPSPLPLTNIANTVLLTCQATNFADESNNNFAISNFGNAVVDVSNPFLKSVYFDGNNDYLTIANNVELQMGTSNFTMEAWIYPTGIQQSSIFSKGATGSTGFSFYMFSDQTLRFVHGASDTVTSSSMIPLNTWTHVAAVREGIGTNQFKLYINGVSVATSTVTTDFSQTNTFKIGAGRDGAGIVEFLGYISNARIVKGTAVYTNNFTVPSSPLKAIANTSLLTCTSSLIDDYSNNNFTITTVGNTSVNDQTPFAYGLTLQDKTLQFSNGGTITITGSGSTAFNNQVIEGIAIDVSNGNASISMTSSSAKTFAGNSVNYSPIALNQGGTGTLTVTGNNAFKDLSASTPAANTTILFTAGTTTTFNAFTLTSASGNTTNRILLNSTVEGSKVYLSRANANAIFSGANYLQCRNIDFIPYSVDGSDYLRWWIGDGSLTLVNNKGAVFQTYDANTSPKVYLIEANTSWVVPDDFNVSNNKIHLFGAGGAGANGSVVPATNAPRAAGGGGGGGGGYTQISNLYAYKNQKLVIEIGSGGTIGVEANGSNTILSSWYGSFSAGGGKSGGLGTNTLPGGAGGTGGTFNGGTGGDAQVGVPRSSPVNNPRSQGGGGGGGGAGGAFGAGASGGLGGTSQSGWDTSPGGGGGGGSSGGTAGSAAQSGGGATVFGGSGGNNADGFGQGIGSTGSATASFSGGGGAGSGSGATIGASSGSTGFDVLNSFGAGSGAGGSAPGAANNFPGFGVPYGGGGGGGGTLKASNTSITIASGGNGGSGGAIITYTPATAPVLPNSANNAFFTLFQ